MLEEALEAIRDGRGGLVEIVGEPGIGKTRLIEEAESRAQGLLRWNATCQAYTASTPYAAWRDVLREALEVGWEDSGDEVGRRLHGWWPNAIPTLLPWLPLLAVPLDAVVEPTPEVDALDESFRRPKLHDAVGRMIGFLVLTGRPCS